MKLMIRITPFLLLLLLLSACPTPPENHWREEFEGAELSSDTWNFELGDGCPELCGWGNNEAQVYTRSNHRLEDGMLIITARKEDSGYTSARLTTRDKMEFQYGRLEARAKLPTGTGVWPAIWLLGSNIGEVGWPRCGEIDIMEYVGKAPGEVHTSLHTPDSHGNTVNTMKTPVEEIEEGFHLYAVEWEPDRIEFFIDGRSVYRFAPEKRTEEIWPFDQPFYLIVNLAVGGNFGGPEIDDSIFPQEF
ncbi:MAG: glycoside hydrolase family 16 protein, partial [Robiginitalea sp.]|nr:glycoside hydrolase family 16 protein [Robiginitalea sp.]